MTTFILSRFLPKLSLSTLQFPFSKSSSSSIPSPVSSWFLLNYRYLPRLLFFTLPSPGSFQLSLSTFQFLSVILHFFYSLPFSSQFLPNYLYPLQIPFCNPPSPITFRFLSELSLYTLQFFSSKILIQLPFPVTTSFLETWNLFPLFLPAPLPYNFLNFSSFLQLVEQLVFTTAKSFGVNSVFHCLPITTLHIGKCIIFVFFLNSPVLYVIISDSLSSLLPTSHLFVNSFLPIRMFFSPSSIHPCTFDPWFCLPNMAS